MEGVITSSLHGGMHAVYLREDAMEYLGGYAPLCPIGVAIWRLFSFFFREWVCIFRPCTGLYDVQDPCRYAHGDVPRTECAHSVRTVSIG